MAAVNTIIGVMRISNSSCFRAMQRMSSLLGLLMLSSTYVHKAIIKTNRLPVAREMNGIIPLLW